MVEWPRAPAKRGGWKERLILPDALPLAAASAECHSQLQKTASLQKELAVEAAPRSFRVPQKAIPE